MIFNRLITSHQITGPLSPHRTACTFRTLHPLSKVSKIKYWEREAETPRSTRTLQEMARQARMRQATRFNEFPVDESTYINIGGYSASMKA
jgi:hypothetical protein